MSESRSHLAQTHAFSAFISYSHADSKRVQKLHSQIESYRFPKGVRPLHRRNAKSGSVGRVFRDRSDLSASESLSDAITDALDRSEALIVVCSPSSRDSRWVTQEVSYFREHRPGKPILAAVLDGVPSDVFPECLTTLDSEPLAADLRSEGDGWRLGLLKLVSGITGVPLDDLVQRDSQRQIRRVMAVTGATALLAIVMAVMTTIAIQSRNEAQFQQAEAEGLIAYMLDDLRTQLRGVGRPELMSGVNQRVLQYFSNQGDLSSLSDDQLERRSRTLHGLAEDQENLCDWPGALAFWEEAEATTSDLLERSPSNAERVFTHAQSEYWVGYAAWQMRDLAETEQHWRGYLDQSLRLAELEPGTARTEMELGYSKGNMCEVLGVRPETRQEARDFCEKAIGHFERAVAIEPENEGYLSTLANRHGWTADIHLKLGDFVKARYHREIEQGIIEELLSRDPEYFDYRLRATYPHIGFGEIAMAEQQHNLAQVILADVSKQLEELAETAPTNAVVTEVQLRTLLSRERAHEAADDPKSGRFRDEARALFDLTIERLEREGKLKSCGALKRFETVLKEGN